MHGICMAVNIANDIVSLIGHTQLAHPCGWLAGHALYVRACSEVQAEQVNRVYWEDKKKPEIRRSEQARSAGSPALEGNALSSLLRVLRGAFCRLAGQGQRPLQGVGRRRWHDANRVPPAKFRFLHCN